MTALAPTLQAFFTAKLPERQASPNTVAAYRDTWRLFLTWINTTTGLAPTSLDISDLDADTVRAFLDHLETDRHVAATTRNARLAGIHSLFKFATTLHPEHADTIARVLAIGPKRSERPTIKYLTPAEADALVTAPDLNTRLGRRDHAILTVAIQTGLRASELITTRRCDLHLANTGSYIACDGKGRKHRHTPLTAGIKSTLERLLTETGPNPNDPIFTGSTAKALTRDALRRIVDRHTTTAATSCPSLATKRVTPHVLRHTCAMRLLEAGIDTSVIALWLGHESPNTTQIYLHAHIQLKENALAKTRPIGGHPGRYKPPDHILDFLQHL